MDTGQDLATFNFKTVFISDFHLGSGKTATPYLYEFLKHLNYDRLDSLYLVGDVIGGWERLNKKQKPVAEMEKRVLDVLNYAAEQSVKIHLLPGNHDEKLRPLLHRLEKRKIFDTFHKNIIFENESYYETEGADKKRLKIIHGDQHDPNLFVKPWFRPITTSVSALYDGMVTLNYHVSGFLYKNFGMHVSFAKSMKSAFKKTINFFFSHESLLKGLETDKFDGILMGHTHMAGIRTFKNKGRTSYLINDGDWVESSTLAYTEDSKELPKIMNYKAERERLGFGELPDEEDVHPAHFAAMRDKTKRQIRMIQAFWPSSNHREAIEEYNALARNYREQKESYAKLTHILADITAHGSIDTTARKEISDILADTRRSYYKSQKEGIKRIFAAYASDQPMAKDDRNFAKTVVREFSMHSERRMKQSLKTLRKAAKRLDYPLPRPAT